jgi:hypothetical protein
VDRVLARYRGFVEAGKMNQKIVTLIAILTAFASTFMFIDSRYALSDGLKIVELRLEHKVVGDRLTDVQERMWKLEDRFPDSNMPDLTKEEYRILQEEKDHLDEIIKELIKQQTGGGK